MFLNYLINHAAFLHKVAKKSPQPADQILSEYFRKKKNIGSKERKFISECVFSSFRNDILINKIYSFFSNDIIIYKRIMFNDIDITIESFSLIIFISMQFYSLDYNYFPAQDLLAKASSEINSFTQLEDAILLYYNEFIDIDRFYNSFKNNINSIINISKESNDIETLYSFPKIISDKLKNNLTNDQLISLAHSLNYSAMPCLRVNNIELLPQVLEELSQNSIDFQYSNLTPLGIILNKRVNLNELNFFKKGFAEVQDIGSQLIGYALSPTKNSRILDACAGAGGKSLQLASITLDKSEIIANDSDFSRMKELNSRARRAGFYSIQIKNLTKITNYNDYINYFDYVLIDAPCSGLGTARRNPLLKYKLTEKSLSKLNNSQLEILEYYSKLLKPGGILVYATCSFLPDENRNIVNKFLSANSNFSSDPLEPIFSSHSINLLELKEDDFDLTLYPDIHNSDGFYMARMIKT